MKKQYYLLLIIALVVSACNVKPAPQKSHIAYDAALERRVDSVMAKLTLEEKVGQMAQYTLDVIAAGGT